MARRLYALLLVLFILIPTTSIVVRAAGTGYLAIKDYLGTVWTMDDVQKIVNYYYKTVDGKNVSLADYFWVVVDDDPDNKKYNLRNFTASPLDGKTAVLPLSSGDHYVDIYWFGYHQRQLVHIVENTHYVLNLKTAPVVPFNVASNKPPESAEWDLAYSPDGLKIQRRDGNAYVLFKYNTSYIEVAWLDKDLGGWNYQDLDIYIDTNYQYKFHIKDPANPKYYEEGTGSFLWLSWDVYKVEEVVKWNKTGEILHVSYIVTIAENEAMFKSINEFWDGVGKVVTGQLLSMGYIDSILGQFISLKGAVELIQSEYDNYMGQFHASKYQKTVLLVWEVFATPTQVVVLAHAWDVIDEKTVVKKPITSANAFTIDNRLVFVKQLAGGVQYMGFYNDQITGVGTLSISSVVRPPDRFLKVIPATYSLVLVQCYSPRLFVDNLALYDVEIWLYYKTDTYGRKSARFDIVLFINDTSKADVFEQNLFNHGFSYERIGNEFRIHYINIPFKDIGKQSGYERYIFFDLQEFLGQYLPDAPGYIWIDFWTHIQVHSSEGSRFYSVKYVYMFTPLMTPPQITLLENGYQTVTSAYAVQVFKDEFRNDDVYMLGYYLLGNDPPPVYIINDTYYDIDQDKMHYVKTVITADAYGQTILNYQFKYNKTSNLIAYGYYDLDGSYGKIWIYDDHIEVDYHFPETSGSCIGVEFTNGTGTVLVPNPAKGMYEFNISADEITAVYIKHASGDFVSLVVTPYGGIGIYEDEMYRAIALEKEANYYRDISVSVKDTVRLIKNVTFALFDYNKMSFLNLDPELIKHLLFIPPLPGYGVPIVDWSKVQIITVNLTRPYKLYWWKNDTYEWIEVYSEYDSNTTTYYIKRTSDNTVIETLPNGSVSDYFYKLVYTDTNESYTGYLKNDNGTLKLISVKVTYALTPEDLKRILQEIQLKGIYDKWLEQWNQIAQQLGLVSQTLQNIASGITGAWDWLNRNKWLLLGGFFGFLVLLVLLMSAAGRRR